jgi:uncharacterized protein HemX
MDAFAMHFDDPSEDRKSVRNGRISGSDTHCAGGGFSGRRVIIQAVVTSSALPISMPQETASPTDSPKKLGFRLRISSMTALVLAAIIVSLAGFWWSSYRADSVEREVARRLQIAERALADTGGQLRQASDALRDAQSRLATLESKLSDSVAQQAQLERLYQELAQSRNDAVLAEVESTLVAAAQQLQLGGSVRGAIFSLQESDGRLERIRIPAASALRRAITADLGMLRQAESVDVGLLAAKLEGVAEVIDTLPLLSDPGQMPIDPAPAKAASTSAKGVAEPALTSGWAERLANWNVVFKELRQWVRVRRVDRPDAIMAAPEQAWFVRENLKLRLTQARWALLTRNEPALRADLGRVIRSLETWFDRDQRAVVQALATLTQLRTTSAEIELPSIQKSLSAIRLARAARDPV